MRIGIIVFAYNRSRHLVEVLSALKKNQGVNKIYIFQDGLKCEEHRLEWEKTKIDIEDIDWCEVVYHQSAYNKGLAQSIVDGINLVFKENDAVIVLEDDCVPMPNFISFMIQCFEKYENNQKVYSVSGYSWPIEVTKGSYDVYGCGRISSWGWGTWKDRWDIYQKDYELVRKAKQDKILSKRLALWGMDLENILIANIRGDAESWAVFWALEVIFKGGICINPYKSLICNIGVDGSGIHCGVTDRFNVAVDEEIKDLDLPEDVTILKETENAFANLYGSYTAADEIDESREKVLVYGIGNFFLANEKQVNDDFYIMEFIDGYKKGYFAGRKIIKPEEICLYSYDKILIMIQDVKICIDIARKLLSYNIDSRKIVLGINLYGHCSKGFDEIQILQNGKIQLRMNDWRKLPGN